MERFKRTFLPLLLLVAGVSLLGVYFARSRAGADPAGILATPLSRETATSLPPAAPHTPTASPAPAASPTRAGTPTPVSDGPGPVDIASVPPTRALTDAAALPLDFHSRFGVTGSPERAARAWEAGLRFGSYANWSVQVDPYAPEGVTYWQMIRVSEEGVRTPWDEVEQALAANPGSIWLIGNEPDVNVQDNVTPARYAELYHELYVYIKENDPEALVAIGGVAQPTLLRRAYLDRVLESYRQKYGHPLPVDIWNVHAFTLREEHDSWGVGIPPGMGDGLAMRYEIPDHDNLSILRQNIIEFRAWMADRGYGDRPLLVSEYGILMPHEYGFPPEQIAEFMRQTFDFFLTARNETGYPADDGRLVQWWFWFYLGENSGEWASTYLYDQDAGTLTPLGEAYARYVATHAPSD